MPYLNIRIAQQESSEVAENVVSVLMKHTSELLGKKPDVISISVDFVSPELWFVGGTRVSAQKAVTFYLDIKVTDGTNIKSEKNKYIEAVFSDLKTILGAITPASYIVIHDVRADSWGFQGKIQEYRFIQAQFSCANKEDLFGSQIYEILFTSCYLRCYTHIKRREK